MVPTLLSCLRLVSTDSVPESDLASSFTKILVMVTMNIIAQGVLLYKRRAKGRQVKETMEQPNLLAGLIEDELKKVEAKQRELKQAQRSLQGIEQLLSCRNFLYFLKVMNN